MPWGLKTLNYDACNRALNQAFFGQKRYSGRQLFLQLSDKVATEVSEALGVGRNNVELTICRAVGKTLGSHSDPYAPFWDRWRMWRKGIGGDLPPTTALLFALSHAATLMGNDGDFGGSNFYDRLGKALGYKPEALRFHGKSTERLWLGFNNWLKEQEGDYGRPTARPFNSWTYVNYAQSQAIIRAGELSHFHSIFEDFNLANHDIRDPLLLVPYIERFLKKSTTSTRLKKAWGQKILRKRFCEIVFSELEVWASSRIVTTQEQRKAIASFPPVKLAIALERTLLGWNSKAFLGTDDLERLYKLGDPRIITRAGVECAFHRLNFGSFSQLDPDPLIGTSTLLDGLLIRASNGKTARLWEPRPAIPLQRSKDSPSLWIEASRLPDEEEAAILIKCSRQRAEALAKTLTEIGRSTVSLLQGSSSLPSGWQLMTGIDLTSEVAGIPTELAFVGPIPRSDISIEMGDGMRLDGRKWHVKLPPEITISLPDNAATMQITQDVTPPIQTTPIELSQGVSTFDGSYLASLGVSRFIVELNEGNAEHEAITKSVFDLVDSSSPRKLGNNRFSQLSYNGEICPSLPLKQDETLTPNVTKVVFQSVAQNGAETCAKSGHYWYCDPHEKGMNKNAAKEQRCIRCDRVELTKNRGARDAGVPKASVKSYVKRHLKADIQIVFDGLCYLGSGTNADMDRLLASYEVNFFEGHRILESLAHLGHLLVQYRQGSQSVEGWCMRKPSLEYIAENRAILRGFRNSELLEDLRIAVEDIGGTYTANIEDDAFPMTGVEIVGVRPDVLIKATNSIRDYHGRPIEVVADPIQNLSSLIGKCLPVLRVARQISFPTKTIEKIFDTNSLTWTNISDGHIPKSGEAFRSRMTHARNCFQGNDGKAFAAMPALTKAVALSASNIPTGYYDRSTQRYFCPVGLEPPGLLSRLLCLVSNKLPSMSADQKNTIEYLNVPPVVGDLIVEVMNERLFHEK